eukprot:364909-Chlamydomonas_euryale.AAC.6
MRWPGRAPSDGLRAGLCGGPHARRCGLHAHPCGGLDTHSFGGLHACRACLGTYDCLDMSSITHACMGDAAAFAFAHPGTLACSLAPAHPHAARRDGRLLMSAESESESELQGADPRRVCLSGAIANVRK